MNKDIKKELEKFIFRVGSGVRSEALKIAPVGKDRVVSGANVKGGNLKKDIKVYENRAELSVSIGNSKLAPYALFVHQGTKPYTIKPLKKKALANVGAGAFFGKKVNHPGIKANPYLLTAANNYLKSPSMDKASKLLGTNIGDVVATNIKEQLKDISIKVT